MFNTICFQEVANFYLMSKLYVRMHDFILCHHQLSICHQNKKEGKDQAKKTHSKISDSLLATVQCPRLYCHLLNFIELEVNFYMEYDIIGHVHDIVLEPT